MNTNYFKNLIMRNIFRPQASGSTPAIPSNYYIGLSSSEPNVSGGGVTEPSGDGYARVLLSSLSLSSDGVVTNSSAISFPESQAAWFPSSNPATHYVIYDAATGGHLLMYNELMVPRIIETSTIATIKAGSLYLQLTD